MGNIPTMIILKPYENKLLTDIPSSFWREPSQNQSKDQFNNPYIRTRFRLRGVLSDGHVVWEGWFESREDFDAFCWALTLGTPVPREIWDLPTPMWAPGMHEGIRYEATTVTFISGPVGTNSSYTSPPDWNNLNNTIWTLGAGGNGGAQKSNVTADSGGGGGGAWNYLNNLTFAVPGTTTATYNVGSKGAAQTVSGASTGYMGFTGNAGGDTWFNGSDLASSSVGSKGGRGGGQRTQDSFTTARSLASEGKGSGGYDGGKGSDGGGSGMCAGGGGGAAGPNGVGRDALTLGSGVARTGANGNVDLGGAGGAIGTNGSNGIEWDGINGSGGGGGGAINANAGNGGNYGAGGGGVSSNNGGSYTVGVGGNGLIRISYQPLFRGGNLAMLGL